MEHNLTKPEPGSGTAGASQDLAHRGLDSLVRGLGLEQTVAFIERYMKAPEQFTSMLGGGTTRAGPAALSLPTPDTVHEGQHAPPPVRVPPAVPAPIMVMPTRVGRADSRQWLRTGYELLVIPPGQNPWSVPLNFEQVTLGSAGERRNDIELNYAGITNRQAMLKYQDGQFLFVNETPSLSIQINGHAAERQPVNDNDLLTIGPVRLQIFRLLDVVSELQVVSGPDIGKRWKLNKSLMLMGRPGQRFNDIELADVTVSRSHARLEFHRSAYVLVAESSNNPTRVNGEAVHEPHQLEDHDQIALGETVLLFRIDRARGKRSLKPKEVTLLFSDLRGYSSIAEREPLKPLIDQLHEYLREMSQIIQINGGTLLSYQGDALMAVFGAPTRHADDPDRAVNSALHMLAKLRQMNIRWVEEGRPEFNCGIGINTGMAMVGDIGIDEHLEYAAMGDDTNVTARIEELTRRYDADLIVSEKTYDKLVGRYQVDCLGLAQIRGREQPITIYSIRGYQTGDSSSSREDQSRPSGVLAATPPPKPVAPVTVMGIHDVRVQPEIGLKIMLDIDKIEAPREDPIGVWRGRLQAESAVSGVVIQFQAEAEMTVEASMALLFVCRGEALSKGQPPTPWGLTGTGYFTAAERASSVFLTFSHGTHTSTWSFPVRLQEERPK